MNEYADENDECNNNPIKDVEFFQAVFKSQYGEFQRKHRDVIDAVRFDEFEKFIKARTMASRQESRSSLHEDPYKKIDDEVQMMKSKIMQA